MKIAYCLHGCVGGTVGKSGEKRSGSDEVVDGSSGQISNLLDVDNIDFFIHSWDTNLHDKFLEKYNPKKIKTEPQIVFKMPKHLPDNLRTQSHYSRWYSVRESLNLKSEFESENEFKYDLVILTRFDLYWLRPFDFSTLDTNKIHFDWCTVNGRKYGGIRAKEWPDRIMCGNSENMDSFKTLYENLTEYTSPGQCPQYKSISSHFCIPWHMDKVNLRNECEFTIHHYGGPVNNDKRHECDFTLYRYVNVGK
jgi:hypothetical protein